MNRPCRAPRLVVLTLMALLSASASFAQDFQLVPGSTTPRVQLTGEHFQIQVNGIYVSTPGRGETLSRYGVLGTDLGHSLVLSDRIVFFFGDTVSAYKSGDRFIAAKTNPPGAGDSIGYIPNVDFSQCRYIPDMAEQMARGVRAPVGNAAGCPSLAFYLNPLRGNDEHIFKPFVITGLAADENQGVFRTPTSVIAYNDRAYVFSTTKFQDSKPAGAYWLQSAVARSDQSPMLWNDTNPPTFTKLYTASTHLPVDDPANPPPVEGGPGKFMGMSAVVMNAGAIADLGLARVLPRELQGTDVAFVWGRSWNSDKSDLYLAAVAMRDIDAGMSKWVFYAGNGRWSNNSEADAVGLLQTEDVAHHSVAWNAAFGRFVLTRNASARIVAQFSTTPWGPWSTPVVLLNTNDEWLPRLLHRPGLDQIVQSLVPVYNRDGTRVEMPDSDRGVPYAPALIDTYTQNADGSVTLYYTLSTWNPYQVFLMSSTVRRVR